MARVRDVPVREYLDRLLSGQPLTAAELQELVAVREGQFHDYKSGLLLGGKDATRDLRKDMTAFANADGGFLVIGYDNEEDHRFDGATAPGGATLEKWAGDCLTPVPLLRPRISTTQVGRLDVLVIATGRSRALIPITADGEIAYYIRIEEQTLRVPPYLLSDLMLGRRAQAELSVAARKAAQTRNNIPNLYLGVADLMLQLDVENTSLAHAEDVRIGLVTWVLEEFSPRPEASPALLRHVDAQEPRPLETPGAPKWKLVHVQPRQPYTSRGAPVNLAAFDRCEPELMQPIALLLFSNYSAKGVPQRLDGTRRLDAAVYAVGKDGEPWWYQLSMEYDRMLQTLTNESILQLVKIQACYDQRPRVAFAMD